MAHMFTLKFLNGQLLKAKAANVCTIWAHGANINLLSESNYPACFMSRHDAGVVEVF